MESINTYELHYFHHVYQNIVSLQKTNPIQNQHLEIVDLKCPTAFVIQYPQNLDQLVLQSF